MAEKFIFEVFDLNGNRIFTTEQEKCVPDRETIESLALSNHKFKINGKNKTKNVLLKELKL